MAASAAIKMVVITPERQVLDENASAVVIPAHDGELGILRDRSPLMCELGIGQLRYTIGDQTRRVFIDGGFAQIYDNQVTVLTSRAVPVEDISDDLLRTAEQAVAAHTGTEPDTLAERERAQRRLSTLRRLRTDR
jgi:F-type H+-transporting ATPase subunit epsilon